MNQQKRVFFFSEISTRFSKVQGQQVTIKGGIRRTVRDALHQGSILKQKHNGDQECENPMAFLVGNTWKHLTSSHRIVLFLFFQFSMSCH